MLLPKEHLTFCTTISILSLWATKSEVKKMSPRTGRPKSDNTKSNPIHVRLDNESKTILNQYCQQEGITQTEGIRRGIRKLASDIKE